MSRGSPRASELEDAGRLDPVQKLLAQPRQAQAVRAAVELHPTLASQPRATHFRATSVRVGRSEASSSAASEGRIAPRRLANCIRKNWGSVIPYSSSAAEARFRHRLWTIIMSRIPSI
ncbi:MAG: hypothetical protein MZV64_09255 [Ignavibacteriales bacterium]|nr:hypothetical protein [Ignavibacteriales bacterium]